MRRWWFRFVQRAWFRQLVAGTVLVATFSAGYAVAEYTDMGPSPSVAVMGDDRITQREWDQQLRQLYGERVLNEMVDFALIRAAADEEGVAISWEEVDERLDEIRGHYDSEHVFQRELVQAGWPSVAAYREALYHQMLIEQTLQERVTVTEEEKLAYFEQYGEFYQEQAKVRFHHIELGTLSDAEAVLGQLDDGAAFSDLAERHSLDLPSSLDGGDVGLLEEDDLRVRYGSHVAERAMELSEGEIAGPIEGVDGQRYHIIRVTERVDPAPVVYEDVEDEVEQEVARQLAGDPSLFLGQLRHEADIEILWEFD